MKEDKNNKHESIKAKLKIIGIILVTVGGIALVVGLADFFMAFGKQRMPKLFWLAMIGIPITGIGSGLLVTGFKREISTYMKNESVPVINETAKEIKPAVEVVTGAVKDVINGNDIICECGERNSPDSKFCKKCGRPLKKVCPKCGEEIDADSNFCDNCGTKIE